MSIIGKRVLIIGPSFFSYGQMIAEAIKERGGESLFIPDGSNSFIKKIRFINKTNFDDDYYKKIVIKLQPIDEFDFVLVIKGNKIPPFFYDFLKIKNKNAVFIQYHWDDIAIPSNKGIESTFKYFDRIFTYNLLDAEKYTFNCRPFCYFSDKINMSGTRHFDYDLFFIGSYNENRDEIYEKLKKTGVLNDLRHYKHYYINPIMLLKENLFSRITDFNYSKMSYNKMIYFLSKSRSSLDIPYLYQEGLTTRSFDAILTSTKIITTNEHVKLYRLYDDTNYFILDKNNPSIDMEWLKIPYKKLDSEIIEYYSINSWLTAIFSY